MIDFQAIPAEPNSCIYFCKAPSSKHVYRSNKQMKKNNKKKQLRAYYVPSFCYIRIKERKNMYFFTGAFKTRNIT